MQQQGSSTIKNKIKKKFFFKKGSFQSSAFAHGSLSLIAHKLQIRPLNLKPLLTQPGLQCIWLRNHNSLWLGVYTLQLRAVDFRLLKLDK